jgi:hypothetical protein
MKLHTVNIIEYAGGAVLGIHSFDDTPWGNKEAEELFKKCAKENFDLTKADLEACLDNGYCEGYKAVNNYQVFITHSS